MGSGEIRHRGGVDSHPYVSTLCICGYGTHFENMCHMGANQNIPKNAEKFCGSFYKDDFSEFYPESVFRSENGSKLSIFGPKYVFFAIFVPLGASHGNKIKNLDQESSVEYFSNTYCSCI